MAENIDVSIIIPTYNRLWCLPRAIDSCRAASCKTEIIVIDDGSTDETWQWLQTQIDIISLYQTNQGQTYAINNGVSRATGKYIRFLDSDDFLYKGTIDKQFLKAEKTQADLVYGKVNYYDQSTGAITEFPGIKPWDDFLAIQLSTQYGSHFLGMLFKTDWVKKIPRRHEFALREDRMFLLEYGLLDPTIELTDGCAGYWVQHSGQMQANYRGSLAQTTNQQHVTLFKQIINRLEASGKLTTARKKAACTVLWQLAHWIAKDNFDEAVKTVSWVYKLDPQFNIPGTGLLPWLYRTMGFKCTEQLLRLRRKLINGFK